MPNERWNDAAWVASFDYNRTERDPRSTLWRDLATAIFMRLVVLPGTSLSERDANAAAAWFLLRMDRLLTVAATTSAVDFDLRNAVDTCISFVPYAHGWVGKTRDSEDVTALGAACALLANALSLRDPDAFPLTMGRTLSSTLAQAAAACSDPTLAAGISAAAAWAAALPAAEAPPATGRMTFPFTFVFEPRRRENYRPPFGGPIRPSHLKARAVATAEMVRIPPEDAPVACRLHTPDMPLEVRVHEGIPFRPVLAPSTWRPVTEGGFLRAVLEGHPWRDDPFSGPLKGSEATKGIMGRSSARHRVGQGAAALTEALARCLARAGTLALIAGIVHRSTSWPTLHVACTTGGYRDPSQERIEMHWGFADGLASHDEQDVLAIVTGRRFWWSPMNRKEGSNRPELPHPFDPALRLPLGDHRRLASAFEWTHAALGLHPFTSPVDVPLDDALPPEALVGAEPTSDRLLVLSDMMAEALKDPGVSWRKFRHNGAGEVPCGIPDRDAPSAAPALATLGLAAREGRDLVLPMLVALASALRHEARLVAGEEDAVQDDLGSLSW